MRYFPLILWVMVWGGLYSGGWEQVLPGDFLSTYEALLQGLRALLPLLAGSVALMMLLMIGKSSPVKSAPKRGPLLFLFVYGVVGGFFFFLSPHPSVSLYWSAMFLSVLLVAWAIIGKGVEDRQLHLLFNANSAIVVVLLLFIMVFPLRSVLLGGSNPRLYELPFRLGTQTANGVGRFAGVAGLIALSRFRDGSTMKRSLWLIIFGGALAALTFSQSRTAILGFALGALVLVLMSRKYWWLVVGGPGVAYLLYQSWFVWRAKGSVEAAIYMSGREYTWERAIDASLQSPFFGFGFHADRFLLEGEHVHMAYLHALIQSGILGALLFIAAVMGIWFLIIRNNLFKKMLEASGIDNILLVESIAILTFLTARSFFESTAAFYGIDLLIFVPVVAYIQVWIRKNAQQIKLQRMMKMGSLPSSPYRKREF